MKITVIGTGYVGLVTGACLAEVGNKVLCLDLDVDRINMLNDGGLPIHEEPGLLEMVQRNVAAGRLSFTSNIEESVAWAQIQFIAVCAPDEDSSANLQYVTDAARNIAKYMSDYKVVVDKSTVSVGTADRVSAAMTEELAKRDASFPSSIISNPEFLKVGAAVEDFMRHDRIVIGSNDDQASTLMRILYAPFVRNHDCIILMDIKSAERAKYAPDLDNIKATVKTPAIFDGRNMYSPSQVKDAGLEYSAIGRR